MKSRIYLLSILIFLSPLGLAEHDCSDFINKGFPYSKIKLDPRSPDDIEGVAINSQEDLENLLFFRWNAEDMIRIPVANFLRRLSPNFTYDDILKYGTLNGSFGFYKTAQGVMFKEINIFPAFEILQKELVSSGKGLTADLIIKAANEANRFIYDGTKFIERPRLSYKKRKSYKFDPDDISEEVLQRAQELYGFSHTKNSTKTTLFYQKPGESPRDYYRLLGRYAERIQEMIDTKQDPLWIIVRAMQDLNILHPFEGGNGRTARLLGDALALKLLGTRIYFPRTFYQDLKNSPQVLYKSLERELFVQFAFADIWLKNKKLQAMQERFLGLFKEPSPQLHKSFFENLKIFREMKVKPTSKYTDIPFEDFKIDKKKKLLIKGEHKPPEQLVYSELPKNVTQYAKTVFFGKPYYGKEAALNGIELLFKYGRNNRSINPEATLVDYISSSASNGKGSRSGFFGTSKKFSIAKMFTEGWQSGKDQTAYSVVFFIDPRGSEIFSIADYVRYNRSFNKGDVLNLDRTRPLADDWGDDAFDIEDSFSDSWDEFKDANWDNPLKKSRWRNFDNKTTDSWDDMKFPDAPDSPDSWGGDFDPGMEIGEGEEEVIFYKRLPPNRIMGALMWDPVTYEARYFENSNYIPK